MVQNEVKRKKNSVTMLPPVSESLTLDLTEKYLVRGSATCSH